MLCKNFREARVETGGQFCAEGGLLLQAQRPGCRQRLMVIRGDGLLEWFAFGVARRVKQAEEDDLCGMLRFESARDGDVFLCLQLPCRVVGPDADEQSVRSASLSGRLSRYLGY